MIRSQWSPLPPLKQSSLPCVLVSYLNNIKPKILIYTGSNMTAFTKNIINSYIYINNLI